MRKHFNINTIFIVLMLLTYAFFSSSTPDNLGIPEVIIAMILVVIIVKNSLIKIIDIKYNIRNFGIFYILFIYMLIFPTISGLIINGNDLNNFIRDFIPFLYFFLPIFFYPFMNKNPKKWIILLSVLLLIIGASFGVRHFMGAAQSFNDFGKSIIFGDQNYFPMDPSVIYGATYGILMALNMVMFSKIKFNIKYYSFAIIYFLLGIIAYMSILGIMVRAQIILVLLSIFTLIYFRMRSNYLGVIFSFLLGIFIVVYYFGNYVESFSQMILLKFEAVGLSGRDDEVWAVIFNCMSSFDKFLFGEGWGGLIANPTGGGAKYRFVHNVNMYFMFKGGIIGFILSVAFIIIYIYKLIANILVFRRSAYIIVLLAIFNSTSLNFVLEPGYKMMPIGLILTIYFLIINNRNLLKGNI